MSLMRECSYDAAQALHACGIAYRKGFDALKIITKSENLPNLRSQSNQEKPQPKLLYDCQNPKLRLSRHPAST